MKRYNEKKIIKIKRLIRKKVIVKREKIFKVNIYHYMIYKLVS